MTDICVGNLTIIDSDNGWSSPSHYLSECWNTVNSLRPRQNGRHFADDTFKCIFLNENVRISIENSLKFVPKGPINNIPALVQIMTWRRSGDKPLSEPMIVSLSTHICVTRPQWVNWTLRNKLQWSFKGNWYALIQENEFGNVVCKVLGILYRSRCVN